MAAKAKKQIPVAPAKIEKKTVVKQPLLSKNNVLPAVLLCLFIAVDFVPSFEAADIMGTHWLYLVIINLICTAYIFLDKKNDYYAPVKRISTSLLSLLYIGMFVVAAVSIFSAFNKTETLVCSARLATSLITYFNIALLLYGRLDMFRLFAQLFTLLLLIKATGILVDFFNNVGDGSLDLVVLNLKGNTGNKNIMAASLVIKIPFAIYCIYTSGIAGRIISFIILLVTAIAIFLISSRASYLALAFELLIFIGYCVLNYFKEKNARAALTRIGFVIIPIVVSFFLSQSILNNALSLQEKQGTIGTVTERLATIDFSAKGSGNRILQWASAWDYIKHHPITGAGYGNWKIVSIPYEKSYVDEIHATLHVHNDFLEFTAETGIIGGLLFISIFGCAAFYFLKAIFAKGNASTNNMAIFSLMTLAAYGVDAIFNFPMERPVMQFFFIFSLGLCVNIFLSLKPQANPAPVADKGKTRLLFAALMLVLLAPAFYVIRLTYKSLVAQYHCYQDIQSDAPQYTSEDMKDLFPSIPNLNYNSVPIDAIKSEYFVKEKKYKEALAILDQSIHVNPYLTYNEIQKSKIFIETNQLDSAFYYAKKAFYLKPRAKSSWRLLNIVCAKINDTATIPKAFVEHIQYLNNVGEWNEYISTIINLPYKKEMKLAWADSAIKLYPADTLLKQKRELIYQGAQTTTVLQPNTQKEAADYYARALDAFGKKDFIRASQLFIKSADLNPNNYNPYENIGLCYFSLNNFKEANIYFDKVLQNFKPLDGKSEFFKGLCMIHLGKNKEGCNWLKMADGRGYKEAKLQMSVWCK